MQNRTSRVSVAALYLIALALPLLAQNAALVGTITDPQQAAMPGVTVTLTNVDTGVALTTRTEATGDYEFPFVKPGQYSLKAEQKGFETFVQSHFTLAVSEKTRLDATMRLGESTTLVTVVEATNGVQTESANMGEVVTSKRIAEMPLNGRFFLDLALLSTGTPCPAPITARFWRCRAASGFPASMLRARAKTPPITY